MNTEVKAYPKGMNTDTSILFQEKGAPRFVLNGVNTTEDGESYGRSSDGGNINCFTKPVGYEILNTKCLDTHDTLIILTNDYLTIIGIQDKYCSNFKILIQSTCFRFTKENVVRSEFKLINGCERVVYFTDGNNPLYSVNIDRLDRYVSDVIDIALPREERVTIANEQNLWDCDSFKLFNDIDVPCLELDSVIDGGGSLFVGTYQFNIRYLDETLNPTVFFYNTPTIPIFDENLSSNYDQIDGATSITEGGTSAGGDENIPPVSKAIRLTISNIDTDYKYIEIAVIENTAGLGVNNIVYIKPKIAITGPTMTYLYTGRDINGDISSSLEEVVTLRPSIYTAEYLASTDSTLILGKVKDRTANWDIFQRQASKIGSSYIVNSSSKANINDFSPKSPNTYFYQLSYMRDEIYSFGIVWVFKNGSHSPAFHIPGRPLNTNPLNCTSLPSQGNASSVTETVRCLKLLTRILQEDDVTPAPIVHFVITYILGGDQFTIDHFVDIDYGDWLEEDIVCAPIGQDIIIVSVVYEQVIAGQTIDAQYSVVDKEVTGRSSANMPDAVSGWDTTYYNVGGNDDLSYETTTDKLPRWKAYNTAIGLGDNNGILGYYQCDETYPMIKACDGSSVWGVDICGNDLEGTPVRHHRFPDAVLEKVHDEFNVFNLGIEFFNISAPAEYINDIQGYYIVRVKRDNTNRTILDKGILDRCEYLKGNPEEGDTEAFYSYFRSETSINNNVEWGLSDKTMVFHSPRVYFNRDAMNGTHFKLEGVYSDSASNIRFAQDDFTLYKMHPGYSDPALGQYSRSIAGSVYIDRIESNTIEVEVGGTLLDYTVKNYLASNHLYFNRLRAGIDTDKLYYASLKVYRNVYCNLDTLKYMRTHSCLAVGSNTQVYGGDTFIAKIDWSLQDFDRSRSYMTAYVESEINSELRHDGPNGFCDQHFKGNYSVSILSPPIRNWIRRYEDTQNYTESGVEWWEYVCHDYWGYNVDYSKLSTENEYFPLDSSFDYCKKCLAEFPYRMYSSEKSFQEETIDNWKVIKPNSYADLIGDNGIITDIFVDKDRLFVNTPKGLWQLQTRPNEVVSSEGTIFISAGEFLSIPPRRLAATPFGYGGTNDSMSRVTSEHGSVYVDENSGKIFMLTAGLEEISEYGYRLFFERELPLAMEKQFYTLTGESYPLRDSAHEYGIGYTTAYDPKYRRYIFHKRDFVMTEKVEADFIGIFYTSEVTRSNVYYYNRDNTGFYYVDRSRNHNLISFNDSQFFENRSFTISFDVPGKQWSSFHSFMPYRMYNDAERFYSIVHNDNTVWQHSDFNDLTYYGYKHPWIIEYVENDDPTVDKIFGSVQYMSDVKQYNEDLRQYVVRKDRTVDKMYCYTSDQITAELSLAIQTPYSTLSNDRSTTSVSKVDNSYRVSHNIKDIAINRNQQPLFTKRWQDISTYFNVDGLGNGYIDKVPNPSAININKSVYERAPLKDKYMVVRMSFRPNELLKMSFKLSTTFIIPKVR